MRRLSLLALTIAAAAVVAAPAASQSARTYALPNGWAPEGIASGPGQTLFVGSIPTGRVLALNARTGATREVVPQREGRSAIGLKHHRGRLFVAGGASGRAFVYDARTGEDVRVLTLTDPPTFVNDVAVTRRAAWFTDSRMPRLYRVGLNRRGAPRAAARTIPLTGDIAYDEDPNNTEVNGIAALPNGRTLLVVQTTTGKLFRVSTRTGRATEVPLSGLDDGVLTGADGILLYRGMLFVVQNRLNRVAIVALDRERWSGSIEGHLTHPAFDVPTTVARKGELLYLPNARFGTPPSPDNEFAVVRVSAV